MRGPRNILIPRKSLETPNEAREEVFVGLTSIDPLDIQAVNQKVKLMTGKSNKMLKKGHQRQDICKVCGLEGSGTFIKRHIEASHISGLKFNCDSCNFIAKYSDSLKTHKQGKHEGLTNGCDQCDFKTIFKTSLTRHKYTHNGTKLACDQCDFKATLAQNLKAHKDA